RRGVRRLRRHRRRARPDDRRGAHPGLDQGGPRRAAPPHALRFTTRQRDCECRAAKPRKKTFHRRGRGGCATDAKAPQRLRCHRVPPRDLSVLRGERVSSHCLTASLVNTSIPDPAWRRVFLFQQKETQMNPTQDTLDLVKGALATPDDRIGKTISASTGLLAFDLQMPAKNLYPFVTPLRNSIPRVGGGTGTATNWRQVTALLGSGFDAMGWVPEGQRSGQMSYTTASKSASFVTIGEEDAATYEAISAGRHFEDIQARMTFRLLQKMMLKEEMAILGGNASLQLGTPATPSLSASASAPH